MKNVYKIILIVAGHSIFFSCNSSQTEFALKSNSASACPDNIPMESDLLANKFLAGCQLTPYWALEYIGSDLAKSFVKSLKHTTPTSVGIVDTGFFPENLTSKLSDDAIFEIDTGNQGLFYPDHSKYVTNLILHPTLGSSQLSQVGAFLSFIGDPFLTKAAETLSASNTSVINLSIGLENSDRPNKAIQKLISNGKTLVFAAGNTYPKQPEIPFQNEDLIIVGSLDPTGLVSSYSVQNEWVDILAPAGFEILTTAEDKTYSLFNGTSASAPLVTGVIADLKSILPNLTPNEIEYLIKRTALPLASNATNKNGSGLLNAYKLMRVAERIRQNSPINSQYLLKDNKLYDFSNEAKDLLLQAKKMTESYANPTSLLDTIRKSLFLELTSNSAKMLADLYNKLGYSTNATFYKTLTETSAKKIFQYHQTLTSKFTDYVYTNEENIEQLIHGKLFRYASRFETHSEVYQYALEKINQLASTGGVIDLGYAMKYSYLLENDGSKLLKNQQSSSEGIRLWKEAIKIEMGAIQESGYSLEKIKATLKFAQSPSNEIRRIFYEITPWNFLEFEKKEIRFEDGDTTISLEYDALINKYMDIIQNETDPELKQMAEDQLNDVI